MATSEDNRPVNKPNDKQTVSDDGDNRPVNKPNNKQTVSDDGEEEWVVINRRDLRQSNQTGKQQKKDELLIFPLRPLDDFLLKSARFDIPDLNYPQKWESRVIKNLLYYQSNYFLTYLIVFIFLTLFNPNKILIGILTLSISYSMFYHVMTYVATLERIYKEHLVPFVILTLIVSYSVIIPSCFSLLLMLWILLPILKLLFMGEFIGYAIIFLLDLLWSIIFLLVFGILLPVFMILIHASLRLRNLKNKMINTLEWAGLVRTPMGYILSGLGLEQNFATPKLNICGTINKMNLRRIFDFI